MIPMRSSVMFLICVFATASAPGSAGTAEPGCSYAQLARTAASGDEAELLAGAPATTVCADSAPRAKKGEYLLLAAGMYRRLAMLTRRHLSPTASLYAQSATTLYRNVERSRDSTPAQRRAAENALAQR